MRERPPPPPPSWLSPRWLAQGCSSNPGSPSGSRLGCSLSPSTPLPVPPPPAPWLPAGWLPPPPPPPPTASRRTQPLLAQCPVQPKRSRLPVSTPIWASASSADRGVKGPGHALARLQLLAAVTGCRYSRTPPHPSATSSPLAHLQETAGRNGLALRPPLSGPLAGSRGGVPSPAVVRRRAAPKGAV